jgi:hypothetical protein
LFWYIRKVNIFDEELSTLFSFARDNLHRESSHGWEGEGRGLGGGQTGGWGEE